MCNLFVLFHDYFYSFNLYKNDELLRRGVPAKRMKNSPSCAHVFYKNLNLVISRFLGCMYRVICFYSLLEVSKI